MKQQLNEIRRMQQLAGILKENQSSAVEEYLNFLFSLSLEGSYSDKEAKPGQLEVHTYEETEFGDDDNYDNAYMYNNARQEIINKRSITIRPLGYDVKFTVDNEGDIQSKFIVPEESQLNESHPENEVMAILNRNGVDDDYFESMGGREIEMGSNEWMDIISDITGKDAYNDEFTEEDDIIIKDFIANLERMGIELI